MRKHIIITIGLIGLLSGCSCNKPDIFEEHHIQRDEISLYMKDGKILSYDKLDCQLSYNEQAREFRVIKDDMSFFSLKLYAPIEEKAKIRGDVKWNTGGRLQEKPGLEYEVLKINEEGKIWLWNKDTKIGVIIKVL